jgi:uncharacterized protein (TIGR03118 family)
VKGSAIGQPFKVNIPGGKPTGQVFANIAGNFVINGVNRAGAPTSGQSTFIFASETGNITGWNGAVFTQATPTGPNTNAIVGYSDPTAIYKGLALAQVGGANFLYATDFHNGKIDVLDSQFHKVTLGANGFESFTDPNLPKGYAPFGIALVGGKLYVSYAKQDADAEDEIAGPGLGFVDVFDTSGHLLGRVASQGDLNAPWGMAWAPAGFGDFSGDLLVGNFGDGRINAFQPQPDGHFKFVGQLRGKNAVPISIDGLWGIGFGNGGAAGPAGTLFFAAGPDDEAHGLFGRIDVG